MIDERRRPPAAEEVDDPVEGAGNGPGLGQDEGQLEVGLLVVIASPDLGDADAEVVPEAVHQAPDDPALVLQRAGIVEAKTELEDADGQAIRRASARS